VFVDVTVAQLSLDLLNENIHHLQPVSVGYYVTSVYIDTPHLVHTLDIRSVACLQTPDLPWDNDQTVNQSMEYSTELGGIVLGTYRSRTLRLGQGAFVDVRIYDNPQIVNALVWYVPRHIPKCTGGLVYNDRRVSAYITRRRGRFLTPPSKKKGKTETTSNISLSGHRAPERMSRLCIAPTIVSYHVQMSRRE